MKTFEDYKFKISHNNLSNGIFPIEWRDFSDNVFDAISEIIKKTELVHELIDFINTNFNVNLEYDSYVESYRTIYFKPIANDKIDGIAKYMFSEMTIYLQIHGFEGEKLVLVPRVSYDHFGGGSNGASIFCRKIKIDFDSGDIEMVKFK